MITIDPGRALSSTARTSGFHASANGSPLTTSPSTTVTPERRQRVQRRRVVAQARKPEVPGLPTPVRRDHLGTSSPHPRSAPRRQPGQAVAVGGERQVPVGVVGQLEARIAGDPPGHLRIALAPTCRSGRTSPAPAPAPAGRGCAGSRTTAPGRPRRLCQHPVGHVRVEGQRHPRAGARPVIDHPAPCVPHPRRPRDSGGRNRRRRDTRVRWREPLASQPPADAAGRAARSQRRTMPTKTGPLRRSAPGTPAHPTRPTNGGRDQYATPNGRRRGQDPAEDHPAGTSPRSRSSPARPRRRRSTTGRAAPASPARPARRHRTRPAPPARTTPANEAPSPGDSSRSTTGPRAPSPGDPWTAQVTW